ncbi:fumarylacetoacetate hydrolase family protein [Alkalihalobacillus sp. 1P02AB]|uniref:fumarylacetoacetate hydrolase family protein n=1 Tax=Alkalihalobacillus sp. 1P02AB TaxID=3132260 RepID=UPI0039A4D65B
MKLVMVKENEIERLAIELENKFYLVETVNQSFQTMWPNTFFELITNNKLRELQQWVKENEVYIKILPDLTHTKLAPLNRNPRKIWGIGFNYVKEKKELDLYGAEFEPVTFIKPDTTIIGSDDKIVIPKQSQKVTAEAELAMIIGWECRNVSEKEALKYVAGYTTALDMTAADIHARKPHNIARAKSFDTFFSIGSQLITADEIEDFQHIHVSTWLNNKKETENSMGLMIYPPEKIISFLSQDTTLLPGDVIITGTPGPVTITEGDRVECQIEGFTPLLNKVVRMQ